MNQNVNETAALRDLTDAEQEERDRLVTAARAAQTEAFRNEADFGRHIRALRDQGLNGKTTWPDFVQAEFEISASTSYNLVYLADVCDDLVQAGVEPLTVVSQALVVFQLPAGALRVTAVQRGRELAAQEGCRLRARHLEAACDEFMSIIVSGGGGDAAGPASPLRDEVERTAVRAHDGLVVVLPADAAGNPAATLGTVVGRPVVPYDDALVWPPRSERKTGAFDFARAEMDDVTGLVWPVLAPDPWKSAAAWAPEHGRAAYYPDRLSSPGSRIAPKAVDREATVLVAPGVDVLAPSIPERVAREIIAAAATNSARRYLLLTAHPDRAWEDGWPANVYVTVEAHGTAVAVTDAAAKVQGAVPNALVVRDLAEALPHGALSAFDWVLVRGSRTQQVAYDSIRASLRPDQAFDRGRDVRARHDGYPALAQASSPRVLRPAARPPDDSGRAASLTSKTTPPITTLHGTTP